MSIFDEATSMAALRSALDAVAGKHGGPGPDGVTVLAFCARREQELVQLRDELLNGSYRPRPSRRVLIPKGGGGHRAIAVGCVRDRVVQHAFAATLQAKLDDELHPYAYAYRRGRSVGAAIAAVEGWLGLGKLWALRGDIDSFFDTIPHPLLMQAVERVVEEPEVVRVIEMTLVAGALAGGEIADPGIGTPQGSPLSPFLSNLYLVPFDRAMESAGFGMVRYGDDFCVCTLVRSEAEEAREVAQTALARLRLRLNENKVEIRHHGEGFSFLGFQLDPGGRRPGAKACRSLCKRLQELSESGADAAAFDDTLQGWIAYYGSLAGVELPAQVRQRAEAIEACRAQQVQDLSLGDAGEVHGSDAPGPGPVAPGQAMWLQAAQALVMAQEGLTLDAVRSSVALDVAMDDAWWLELGERLAAFDGGGVAECLARAGRFADAADAASLRPLVADDTTRARAAEAVDTVELPRLAPAPADVQRLIDLLGGAEHAVVRDVKTERGIERQRLLTPLVAELVRQHLGGDLWLGVYPLRANGTVRFAAVRVVSKAKARGGTPRATEPTAGAVKHCALAIVGEARRLGLDVMVSEDPGRGYVVWVPVAQPVTAARAKALATLLVQSTAGSEEVTREVIPAQEVTKPDKPGTPVMLPLGLDPRTGERAWLCEPDLTRSLDPCALLRAFVANAPERVAEALGVQRKLPLPVRTTPEGSAVAADAGEGGPDAVALATSPFRELPRAQDLYAGCAVLRHFVDEAMRGHGLAGSAKYLVADSLGRLGDEAVPALEAVLRHLPNYRPGMGASLAQQVYTHPMSCARIREKWSNLTSHVRCDCRFRIPPGAYPTPVLHAVGAADVPGLKERVHEAAQRGGMARAVLAAMNEGRKELGAKAAALCARLADLRRQHRMLEKTIAKTEDELDAVVREAGDTPLETPSGTLRRIEEGGRRRFVLEV